MPTVRTEPFGRSSDGRPVERYVVTSGDLELGLLSWGGIVQSLRVGGDGGDTADVVLGFGSLAEYEADDQFLGATIGRFGNRIAHGRFTLDGNTYHVPVSDRGHALHGGPEGFHAQVWGGRPFEDADGAGVELTHVSPDGAMGFPGTLETTVTYAVRGREVRIGFAAVTDRPTVLNLTQHSYFNLAGAGAGSVEGHRLRLAADRYLPVDATGIPLGATAEVADTPFDFRAAKPVGQDLRQGTTQIREARGYDHSWLLDSPGLDTVAARLEDPASGRVLEVLTDELAIQFYSGNFLDGSRVGKGGGCYRQGDGLCLETQHLPDSPNRPEFPSVVLRPGETFRSSTVWRFPAT